MGRQHDVFHAHKRGIRAGLVGKHVHGGAAQMAALHRRLQGHDVHDGAAGRVEKVAPRLHLPKAILVEHALRFRRQGHAHGNEIALPEQLVQGRVLHAVRVRPLGIGMAAGVEDAHIEGPGAAGQLLADAAEAHQAQGPVLGAQAHLSIPDAPVHLLVFPLDAAGKMEEQGHQMLRHGPFHLAHGPRHGDAQPTAGCHVHGIVADAPAGDQLQVGAPFQQVRRVALQARDDRVRVLNKGQQLLAPCADAQLRGGLGQDLKAGLRQQPPGPLVRIVSRQNSYLFHVSFKGKIESFLPFF